MFIKFLREGALATQTAFDYAPYLPKGNKPGKWLPKVDELSRCKSGYHFTELSAKTLDFLDTEAYEIEYRGNHIVIDGEHIAQQIRIVRRIVEWDDRTARLFAADCAARVLHLYTGISDAPRKAIEVARLFANGKATQDELAAAGDAAWAAAGDAARDAARAAAWAAEQKWQLARLTKYLSGVRVRPVPLPNPEGGAK